MDIPENGGAAHSNWASLRDLLVAYDSEVEDSLREALESPTGLGRVRTLHNVLRPSIAVHDAVLESALCPLLEDLPGGAPIADCLRRGCRERADLLSCFEAVSHNVAAYDVYPVSGEEIERILEGLARSFGAHAHDETTEVGGLLEAAADSIDPDVIAAKMAVEARRSPTRIHAATLKHPHSAMLKRFYRYLDRFGDWSDTHREWLDPRTMSSSPRARQVDVLKRQTVAARSSARDLLVGYDATLDEFIAQLEAARTDVDRAEAAHSVNAAITIHDSVLGAVLCPLLEGVPDGKPLAARLREGCRARAQLLHAWNALTKEVSAEDLYRLRRSEIEGILDALIESFHAHEKEGTLVAELLEQLPDNAYRTRLSPLEDIMWPWHSEGPAALALRMALWAEAAPTRVHSLLVKHPSSRTLRSIYHFSDHFRDFWDDTPAERWLFPRLPSAPFSRLAPGESRAGQSDEASRV